MSLESVENEIASRGKKVPRHTLREAVEFIRTIVEACGRGPFDRQSIAIALGHSSENGASNSKVGALTHFGLLERSGGAYRLSSIGFGIVFPTSEDESAACIAKAAIEPTVFAELYAEFAGKAIPRLLPNLMQRRFGLSSNASEAAVTVFHETLSFAGLLKNGIVLAEPESEITDSRSQVAGRHPLDDAEKHLASPAVASTIDKVVSRRVEQTRIFPIPLSRSRVANIELPGNLTAGDLERIHGWLRLMEDVLTEAEIN